MAAQFTPEVEFYPGPASGLKYLAGTVASADRTKADNTRWALEQLGAGGRLLLFAHRDHLAPVLSRIRLTSGDEPWALPPMVGMYLKPWFGRDLVTIGHFFATDDSHCGSAPTTAAPDSLEHALAGVPHAFFLLNLNGAPSAVEAWLEAPRELFGVPPLNTASVRPAYDAIFFSRRVSPAIPCGEVRP